MAVFTFIATTVLGLAAGSFAAVAVATVLSVATSIGLSYAARALAGDPNQDQQVTGVQGVQGTLQAGGDIPRSFNLGYSVTAGSLVYANTWQPVANATPNAYLTQVIALADLPGGDILELWVNGEKVTLPLHAADASNFSSGDSGYPIPEYIKPLDRDHPDTTTMPHLWIRYHDGNQTAADELCVNHVASIDRPYESTRVGTGVAYVVVTSHVNDTLFGSAVPTFKFAVSGIPLYDPTKDSTNGGSGSHRYSDPSTWGGDGDNYPAVQAYNILRGIYFNDIWLYGLQRMTAARLPAINWNAQIDKCRAVMDGEPTYRTGGQVSVNVQTVQTIEALLTGCQGRLSEIGGFYKVHLGAPDSPTFSWTDDDILSSEEQNFAPFFGLADSVNGIQATYPDPLQGWNTATAPVYKVPAMIARDGNRNLLANPRFDFVPYPTQVQRLQKSAIEEASRERRHSLSMPPAFWIVEPGDVGAWTSERNGYIDKSFRIDGVTDRANLDVLFNITEVDPSDYDWDHDADFQPTTSGPTILARPAAQGVVDWFVEPYTLLVAGQPRRAAIRLSWDGSMAGVSGVIFEVRNADDHVVVHTGNTLQLAAGAIIVSQSLIPDTDYQARGQYIPSAPRDMLWSDWLDVTTPDVRQSILDFDAALIQRVTTEFDAIAAIQADLDQRISTLTSKLAAQAYTDIQSVRSQLASRSGAAFAAIDHVQTVSTAADAALASDILTVSTQVNDPTTGLPVTHATTVTNATAISGLDGSLASLTDTVTAGFDALGDDIDGVSATVTTHTTAIATLDGYAAGSWGVVIDVNGKIVGAVHLDGSAASSVFDVLASTFRVSQPSTTGGASVPIFTISNVSGTPKIVWRADMVGDGALDVRTLNVGSLSSITGNIGTLTTGMIQSPDGKFLIDATNKRIVISD